MGVQFSRVPHAVLDMLMGGGGYNENDARVLAFMYRHGSHPDISMDGIELKEGEIATSYTAISSACNLTTKQARNAVTRLIRAGHLVKLREERRGRYGNRQYTVFGAVGLTNPDFYSGRAGGWAGGEDANFPDNTGKNDEVPPAKGQAVGQAVSEKGQAILEQKSKESSILFDAGGAERGRQYIYISTPDTREDTYKEHKNDSTPEEDETAVLLQNGFDVWD